MCFLGILRRASEQLFCSTFFDLESISKKCCNCFFNLRWLTNPICQILFKKLIKYENIARNAHQICSQGQDVNKFRNQGKC